MIKFKEISQPGSSTFKLEDNIKKDLKVTG
jgi:hypothetical protein